MTDIIAFISARLGETQADAEAAQAADPAPWIVQAVSGQLWRPAVAGNRSSHVAAVVVAADGTELWDTRDSDYGDDQHAMASPSARHIARHDPAHVLAEVKAKRAILALHSPVWLVNQWVQDVDDKRHQGDLVVCRSCEPRTGFMTDQWPCDTVKLLAAPDAEHPDYNPAWRVE